MNKKQKIVVLGIIENNAEEILVSQRLDPKIPSAHLKWDVPGGTNKIGESLKETLIREIKEESNINAEILELLPECVSKEWTHDKYPLHVLVFCYECRLIDGTLRDCAEMKHSKWISPKKSLELDLLPTTRTFIESFVKNKLLKSSSKNL